MAFISGCGSPNYTHPQGYSDYSICGGSGNSSSNSDSKILAK